MKAAACSWRVIISSIDEFRRLSTTSRFSSPGTPKTRSTPSFSSDWTSKSDPLGIDFPPLFFRWRGPSGRFRQKGRSKRLSEDNAYGAAGPDDVPGAGKLAGFLIDGERHDRVALLVLLQVCGVWSNWV